jgi:Rrf2 family protein
MAGHEVRKPMFKLYSKSCQYALRALVYAGGPESGGRMQARDLCDKAGVPESFTRKVLQSLVQAGLLEAQRGPGGGYRLARDPDEIPLLEIIKSVDGPDTFDSCVLGFEECSGENPCPLHALWLKSKQPLLKRLDATTLKDLINTTQRRARARRESS